MTFGLYLSYVTQMCRFSLESAAVIATALFFCHRIIFFETLIYEADLWSAITKI